MVASQKLFYLVLFIAVSTLGSCENNFESESSNTSAKDTQISKEKTAKRTFNTAFDGKLYSIPSAVQTSILINSLDIPFDSTLLYVRNIPDLYQNYTFQALHLGIYFADVGYSAVYDQREACLSCLEPMQKLAKNLEMTSVFTPAFSTPFKSNIKSKDSLLMLLNTQFSEVDYYLKEHDRKNISALILMGGWLKSIYITTQLYKESHNEVLLKHLGAQKQNMETILALIEKHNINGQNDDHIYYLTELNDLYKKVNISNEFILPTTYAASKITVINNKTNTEFSDRIMIEIMDNIEKTYTKVINS